MIAGATKIDVAREAPQWGRLYLALYVGYVALGMAGRWSGWQNGDQLWFVDAARHILDGSWRIYEFRPDFSIIAAPPLGVAYSYSPLLALVLAPFVALADALGGTPLAASVGGSDELAYRLIAFPLLVADVLAMAEVRRLARAWRPAADEVALFLGILLTLGLTGLLQVSASRNHHEGLVLLLLLLALRLTPHRLVLGAVCAGLALAAKQTSALELAPLGLVLLFGGGQGTGLRRGLAWGAVAGSVGAAFFVPAVLADPGGAVYALVTLPGRLIPFGPGLPVWLDEWLAAGLGADSAAYSQAHAAILAYSNTVLVAAAVLLPLAILVWARRRGPVGLIDSRLLALVALGGVLQIVLGKWVGSHYYQLPLALVLLWDTVRSAPRWPWLGFAASWGFRALALAAPLPLLPIPRTMYILALFLALVGIMVRGALAPPETRPPAPSREPALVAQEDAV